jgi:tRNA nucleotidyltransferase (CCA-adding enzyme)
MQAYEILQRVHAVLTGAEARTLLGWELHWYAPQNTQQNEFADDLRRETLNLKLPVNAEDFAALQLALSDATLSEGDLQLALPPHGRQPSQIRFSTQTQRLMPSDNVRIAGSEIDLSGELSASDALIVARLAARFPQLIVHTEDTPRVELKAADEVPASLRRHAFRGIILGRRPTAGFRLLDSLGLLDIFLPEVTAGRGLSQNRFHAHDIFEHLLRAADGALDLNEPVRWSALLHDVGKVPTRVESPDGESTFHNHEMYSARMVVPIMKRLAVPVSVGQKVKFLVRNHMFHYTDEWSDKAVRRFVKKVPLDELQDLISLRLADRKGSGKKTAFPKALQKLMEHIDELIAKEQEFKIKDLAIDGHTLMEIGMPPSREMGDMLKYLFEEVKAGRAENDREKLLGLVEARRSAAGAST